MITVPKPVRTDIDDGMTEEAFAAQRPIPTYLAQVSPAPPELVEEVEKRFLATNVYSRNEHTRLDDDPLHQWAVGRAALAHQLSWWEQHNKRHLIQVQDFYAPDDAIKALFPAWVESEIQAGMIADGLVPFLTFATVQVGASTVRDTYDSSAENTRALRQIGPGGELPKVKLSLADSDIHLYKYGRMIEAAYEVIAEQKVDVLAHHLRRVGMQIAVDETDAALSVLIAGDGTTAGSAETDSTDVDVATAGSIVYSDLLSWVYDPDQPYKVDKAVGGKTDLALIDNLAEFKSDKAGVSDMVDPGRPSPLTVAYRRWDGGVSGSSYADRLVIGIDSRQALKQYTKGSLLQESDSIINRQVRRWAVSNWCGWRKFDAEAVHVLDTNTAL